MACKVNPGTTAVVAVVYGTTRAVESSVAAAARLLSERLAEYAGATQVSVETLP
jgi:ribonuclease HI